MPKPKKSPSVPLDISGVSNGRSNKPSSQDFMQAFFEQAMKHGFFPSEMKNYQPKNEQEEEEGFDAYSILGTLPDWAVKQHINDGIIGVSPLPEDWEEKVDEVTIDFHLGNKLRVFTSDGLNTIDLKHTTREEMESMMRSIDLKPGQPFILTENDFVIATTKERLTLPDNIIGHLHGKSSLARLGIVVHSTAARFDPGWDGCPVLEFGTFLRGKKIVIYEGSPICAFSFEKLAAPVERSYKNSPNNRYGGYDTPMVSNIMGKRSK